MKKILVGALFLLLGLAVYLPNYARLCKLRKANQRLRRDIVATRNQIEGLRRNIENISKDPRIMEAISRDELGVAREGEIVVDIKE